MSQNEMNLLEGVLSRPYKEGVGAQTTNPSQAFLLCDDLDRPGWASRLSDTRSAYESLKDYFLKHIKHPNEIQSTIDPLAEDEAVGVFRKSG